MNNADKAGFLVDLVKVMNKHGCTGFGFWQKYRDGGGEISFHFGDEPSIDIDEDMTSPSQLILQAEVCG
jgi:hypothetical protein